MSVWDWVRHVYSEDDFKRLHDWLAKIDKCSWMYNLCTWRFFQKLSAHTHKKTNKKKTVDEIKIVPVPSGPNFAQVGTLKYLCRKDEYGDDFLAFVGAKQIKTPCSHFPNMYLSKLGTCMWLAPYTLWMPFRVVRLASRQYLVSMETTYSILSLLKWLFILWLNLQELY